MQNVTTKVVFDRKRVSDTTKTRGLVQIEVVCARKQMFFTTGIKVLRNQWDKARCKVKNCAQADSLNEVIEALLAKVADYRAQCIKESVEFTFEGLKESLARLDNGNFLAFMEERIQNRQDIKESTRKHEMSILSILKKFGLIANFADLTPENILKFDEWMRKRGIRQTTIEQKHHVLKCYVRMALLYDKIKKSPYDQVRVEHGKPEEGRYLLEDDMKKIMTAKLPRHLLMFRDLMVVQFYTGLAYSDLMRFDFTKVEEVNGKKVLLDTRLKTGEQYYIMLFKPVLRILAKYDNILPRVTNPNYNARINEIAKLTGIKKKNIASHWLRRGYGMTLLNKGVPLQVVSKSMGHAKVATTERAYAKLLGKTVVNELAKVDR